MNQINYQKKLDMLLEKLASELTKPKHLFLHSCCAPCSSYVLEYLSRYMEITVFYYNPNISPQKEYLARVEEQKRLIASMPLKHPVHFLEGSYQPECFYEAVRGHEEDREGGERCFICYELRLREAARLVRKAATIILPLP